MSEIDTVARPPGGSRPSSRRRSPLRRRALTCWAAATLAVGATLAAAPPAQAATPMYLGAVGGVQQLSASTGQPLATHAYAQFNGSVPEGRMITVRTSSKWSAVANAQPGSALYNDIVRWAQTIKGRPGPVMFAYHHEPEASGSGQYGTPAQFIAAWRRVVTIFRAQGVTNVQYTWQMTDWSFRAAPSDARYAAKWYPGDAYVDVVGADVYNWHDCGHGKNRWMELSALMDPVVAFARARGKKAALPEFAADPAPQRAQWLQNARTYLTANQGIITAAFYFNRGPTNPANQDCSWTLTTRAEFDAYAAMARDRTNFRT